MKYNVVSEEYSIAATEILEVLKFLPEELISKIPRKLITFFEEVSIKNYIIQIDFSQGLDKIQITNKTRALLAMIYKNYLCSKEERKEFEKILYENEEKYQKVLREKYNPDKIFKNELDSVEKSEVTTLVEYQKERWYQKVFRKFFKLLKND